MSCFVVHFFLSQIHSFIQFNVCVHDVSFFSRFCSLVLVVYLYILSHWHTHSIVVWKVFFSIWEIFRFPPQEIYHKKITKKKNIAVVVVVVVRVWSSGKILPGNIFCFPIPCFGSLLLLLLDHDSRLMFLDARVTHTHVFHGILKLKIQKKSWLFKQTLFLLQESWYNDGKKRLHLQ